MAAARFGANETECNGFSVGVHFKDSREAAKVQRHLKCGGKRSATPLFTVRRFLFSKAPAPLRSAGALHKYSSPLTCLAKRLVFQGRRTARVKAVAEAISSEVSAPSVSQAEAALPYLGSNTK